MLVNGISSTADSKKMAFSFVSDKFSGGFKICKCLCFMSYFVVNGIWTEFRALFVRALRLLLATQELAGSFVLPGLSINTELKI